MKIAILGFTKISYMPYMHFFLDRIDTSLHEVHLIYWRRDETPDAESPKGVTAHALECNMSDALSLRKKVPFIMQYRRFAKKVLKEVSPDFLVVLHTTTAFTVYDLLMGKYAGRYDFNFLDITYEKNRIYRKMVGQIIDKSCRSYTSSDGFRSILPQNPKLHTSHNITLSFLRDKERYRRKRASENVPIRIAFWGLIRHTSLNRLLIEKLSNDPRFELHYYGRAQGAMLALLQQSVSRYENIFYHGEYAPSDRPQMAMQTDLIHNLYDSTSRGMRLAMSNKYYDSLVFAVPQLCMEGSLMGDFCNEKGVGFSCDPSAPDFADNLFLRYQSMDYDQFVKNCDQELKNIVLQLEHETTGSVQGVYGRFPGDL